MPRKQFNVRLPKLTLKQIEELIATGQYESQAHVIMTAVERLHQQQCEDSRPKGKGNRMDK